MKFLLLIFGIIFILIGILMFKSKHEIISVPAKTKAKSSSSLFDKIVNDNFEES